MNCPRCDMPIASNLRHCPACQSDVGFPNVRAASDQANVARLLERADEAFASCEARGCTDELHAFGAAVRDRSRAVLTRTLEDVVAFVSSDSPVYSTFHQQVAIGQRIPQDNDWDNARVAVDGTLFPNYASEIRFAALALDIEILGNYGDCAMAIKERAIEERATVFEANSITFCRDNLALVVGTPVPPGHSAEWSRRDLLATAKLHGRVERELDANGYARLLNDPTVPPDGDYIEVHIFGQLHRRSIEGVVVKQPSTRTDRIMIERLRSVLSDLDIEVEVAA